MHYHAIIILLGIIHVNYANQISIKIKLISLTNYLVMKTIKNQIYLLFKE